MVAKNWKRELKKKELSFINDKFDEYDLIIYENYFSSICKYSVQRTLVNRF